MIWEIGNKILKIGLPRRMKKIPYHHIILQPIINNDFKFVLFQFREIEHVENFLLHIIT